MWQEIITYIIIAGTFGLVIYKAILKPIAKRLRILNKSLTSASPTPNFSFCSSCTAGYKCDTCPFVSAEVKKYIKENKKEKISCCS